MVAMAILTGYSNADADVIEALTHLTAIMETEAGALREALNVGNVAEARRRLEALEFSISNQKTTLARVPAPAERRAYGYMRHKGTGQVIAARMDRRSGVITGVAGPVDPADLHRDPERYDFTEHANRVVLVELHRNQFEPVTAETD